MVFAGNCWYIAGAATLAIYPELFQKVVPGDQGFGDNYAGSFHVGVFGDEL